MKLAILALLAGCAPTYVPGNDPPDAAPDPAPDAAPDAPADAPLGTLVDTRGHYRGVCDGSAAVGLDATHFLAFSDNDNRLRVFERGATAAPAQQFDLTGALAIANEADFEDAALAGTRVYVIGSHGRKNDGTLDRSRYHLAAIDLGGAAPTLTFAFAGRTDRLLDDMLDAANWTTPNTEVIAALRNASQLDQSKNSNLAPKASGTNIEGLAAMPGPGLVIGLRNPRPNGRAIVVTLANAPQAIAGAPAHFTDATALDLGGLGIRAMTWSAPLATALIVAGPSDGSDGPFRLYRWGGLGTPAMFDRDLAVPAHAHPEAIVTYPGTRDVQLLYDGDGVQLGNNSCDNTSADQREFGDQIVHLL
jgi:uncharacterized protein DUF3616